MPQDDRRNSIRFKVEVPARIKLKSDAEQSFSIEILDISIGGARIQCLKPVIQVGQEVFIEVDVEGWRLIAGQVTQLDDIEYIIDEDASSTVQWANPKEVGTFGIKFKNLTESQKAFLHKILTKA